MAIKKIKIGNTEHEIQTTITNVDGLQDVLDEKVPATTTVNGKALSENITLTASDVGAAASSHEHSAEEITSGTLSVQRGGTGVTSFTSGNVLIGAGTDAVTTRAIRNNQSTTAAISADAQLITSNTLYYALGRNSSVAAANTAYANIMARGMSLNASDQTPSKNGTICWTYE